MSNTQGHRTHHSLYTNVPLATHRKVIAICKREKISASAYLATLVLADVDQRDSARKAARKSKNTIK